MKTSCAQGCKTDFGCVPRNWGCRHDEPLLFGTSQWKCGPPILFLLLHRLPWSIFWLGYFIYDVNDRITRTFYFEYLTKWQLMLIVLNSLVGLIVAIIMQAGRMREKWNHFIGFYWVLWSATTTLAPTVTLMFWALLYNPATLSFDFISIVTHIINTVYTILDLWIVAIPLRAYHFYFAVLLATLYVIFLAIHGSVTTGELIYTVFNFREKPGTAVVYWLGGVVMGISIWFILFGLYKLRLFISERCDGCQRRNKVVASERQLDKVDV